MPRPTGSQNRSTEQVRRAIAELIEKGAPKLQGWLDTVAEGDEAKGIKPDPAKAADLMLKAAEYHIPKLARMTVEGDSDNPLTVITKVKLEALSDDGDDSTS